MGSSLAKTRTTTKWPSKSDCGGSFFSSFLFLLHKQKISCAQAARPTMPEDGEGDDDDMKFARNDEEAPVCSFVVVSVFGFPLFVTSRFCTR
jgi:hypothetical protein